MVWPDILAPVPCTARSLFQNAPNALRETYDLMYNRAHGNANVLRDASAQQNSRSVVDFILLVWGWGSRAAPRISVIVPVYRAQEYLADCVNSLLAQTFPDFELRFGRRRQPGRMPPPLRGLRAKGQPYPGPPPGKSGRFGRAGTPASRSPAVRFWLLSMRTTGSSRRFCSGCMRASGMRRSPCAA